MTPVMSRLVAMMMTMTMETEEARRWPSVFASSISTPTVQVQVVPADLRVLQEVADRRDRLDPLERRDPVAQREPPDRVEPQVPRE